jgi:hypothetical protein
LCTRALEEGLFYGSRVINEVVLEGVSDLLMNPAKHGCRDARKD